VTAEYALGLGCLATSDVLRLVDSPANPGNQPHPTYYCAACNYRYLSHLTLHNARPLTTHISQHVWSRECSLQPEGVLVPPCRPRAINIRQFTAKSLNRQALKAGKEEQAEKTKLEKVDMFLLCWRCRSDEMNV
jgi:hypothetical protein